VALGYDFFPSQYEVANAKSLGTNSDAIAIIFDSGILQTSNWKGMIAWPNQSRPNGCPFVSQFR